MVASCPALWSQLVASNLESFIAYRSLIRPGALSPIPLVILLTLPMSSMLFCRSRISLCMFFPVLFHLYIDRLCILPPNIMAIRRPSRNRRSASLFCSVVPSPVSSSPTQVFLASSSRTRLRAAWSENCTPRSAFTFWWFVSTSTFFTLLALIFSLATE